MPTFCPIWAIWAFELDHVFQVVLTRKCCGPLGSRHQHYNANTWAVQYPNWKERACRFCPLAIGAGEQRDLIPLGLSPRSWLGWGNWSWTPQPGQRGPGPGAQLRLGEARGGHTDVNSVPSKVPPAGPGGTQEQPKPTMGHSFPKAFSSSCSSSCLFLLICIYLSGCKPKKTPKYKSQVEF